MSGKERDRLALNRRVCDRELTQVRAAELLGLEIRQVKRLVAAYRRFGDRGDLIGSFARMALSCIRILLRYARLGAAACRAVMWGGPRPQQPPSMTTPLVRQRLQASTNSEGVKSANCQSGILKCPDSG